MSWPWQAWHVEKALPLSSDCLGGPGFPEPQLHHPRQVTSLALCVSRESALEASTALARTLFPGPWPWGAHFHTQSHLVSHLLNQKACIISSVLQMRKPRHGDIVACPVPHG